MEPVYQITPEGFTLRISQAELDQLDSSHKQRALRFLFSPWDAVLELGLEAPVESQSAVLKFLQKVGAAFISDLLKAPGLETLRENIQLVPDEYQKEKLLNERPFVKESSLIDSQWIDQAYAHLLEVFKSQIVLYPHSVKKFFNEKNPALNPAESIFFHLVEYKNGLYPFAFLATYTHITPQGDVRHLPLSEILHEYQGDQKKILELLSCLNQAAEICPELGSFMTSGELFHTIGLDEKEAYAFLKSVEELEKIGIVCRIPNWWRSRSSRVTLNVKLGNQKSLLGLESLIALSPELSADGMKLTSADIRKLLASAEGLSLIKGRWVEVNHARLKALLERMESMPQSMSLGEALRLETGMEEPDWMDDQEEGDIQISNGKWMGNIFHKLTDPKILRKTALPRKLQATLRPYQQEGYNWLNALSSLGFGALLADDMGLGKTVQTLAWLEKEHQNHPEKKALLVVPASLLANWSKEAAQFTPDLKIGVIHGKAGVEAFENTSHENLPFLNLTTYGMASRLESLQEVDWDFLILDEAQAIKNPKTKQTRSIKQIPAGMRLAMTGTPVENDLVNLWSIFDFLNHGMLGNLNQFGAYLKDDSRPQSEKLSRLQKIISPFLLRRLKSDKSIINDLPDKVEQNDYITLSEQQRILYTNVVDKLKVELENRPELGESTNAINRRGLVLATLNKLKQICNHPDQYLGQKQFTEAESGKFEMLEEICRPIAENRESVLIFTQYREMTEPIARFLEQIFGAPGYVIHGQTPIKQRQEIVDAFNKQETYIPFVVLSLRAAGTGLNLTQASHVVHFDRWWNPAVENQATDRAYRIGQKRNVIVHKFVCSNTIEEAIDKMITSKQKLADDVISSSTESWLTSLSDDELIQTLRLTL